MDFYKLKTVENYNFKKNFIYVKLNFVSWFEVLLTGTRSDRSLRPELVVYNLWALHASNTSVPEYKKKKLKFN